MLNVAKCQRSCDSLPWCSGNYRLDAGMHVLRFATWSLFSRGVPTAPPRHGQKRGQTSRVFGTEAGPDRARLIDAKANGFGGCAMLNRVAPTPGKVLFRIGFRTVGPGTKDSSNDATVRHLVPRVRNTFVSCEDQGLAHAGNDVGQAFLSDTASASGRNARPTCVSSLAGQYWLMSPARHSIWVTRRRIMLLPWNQSMSPTFCSGTGLSLPSKMVIGEIHEGVPVVVGDVVLAGPDAVADGALDQLIAAGLGHLR